MLFHTFGTLLGKTTPQFSFLCPSEFATSKANSPLFLTPFWKSFFSQRSKQEATKVISSPTFLKMVRKYGWKYAHVISFIHSFIHSLHPPTHLSPDSHHSPIHSLVPLNACEKAKTMIIPHCIYMYKTDDCDENQYQNDDWLESAIFKSAIEQVFSHSMADIFLKIYLLWEWMIWKFYNPFKQIKVILQKVTWEWK